jgi:hypothetical protein
MPSGATPGKQRCNRGAFESVGHAEHRNGSKDHRRAQPPGEAAPSQEYRRRAIDELANLYDASAVITVSSMTGDENEQRRRDELRQTDHAKGECAIGQRINLPAHGNRADQKREFGKNPRNEIKQKRLMAK